MSVNSMCNGPQGRILIIDITSLNGERESRTRPIEAIANEPTKRVTKVDEQISDAY